MNAQDFTLDDYVWKNRIVVLISNEDGSVQIKEQLNILLANPEELLERKLIVLEVKPEKFRIVDPSQLAYIEWVNSGEVYKKIKVNSKPFEIQLIGLDGGVKMKDEDVMSPDDLFDLIDSMPMRLIELRNRKQ